MLGNSTVGKRTKDPNASDRSDAFEKIAKGTERIDAFVVLLRHWTHLI